MSNSSSELSCLAYLLTPWCRVLEKLAGLHLVKKFPAFYGTRRFITPFTSARHLSISWASSIQSIPPHPTSWRSILILSSHLRLDAKGDTHTHTHTHDLIFSMKFEFRYPYFSRSELRSAEGRRTGLEKTGSARVASYCGRSCNVCTSSSLLRAWHCFARKQ